MGYTSFHMNIKVILGITAAIVILVIGFLLLRPKTALVPLSASPAEQNAIASTTSQTSQPQQTKSNAGITSPLKITVSIARFDAISFFSTSTYPTISGIANTPKVGVIINDSKGKGIVGTSEIPVTRGHWFYSTSVALVPGTYTLVLFVGNTITEIAKLIVNTP